MKTHILIKTWRCIQPRPLRSNLCCIFIINIPINTAQKKKQTREQKTVFTISLRGPYRLYNMLRTLFFMSSLLDFLSKVQSISRKRIVEDTIVAIISHDFLFFTKFLFPHKWNGASWLVIKKLYTSSLTSCQMT